MKFKYCTNLPQSNILKVTIDYDVNCFLAFTKSFVVNMFFEG